MTKTRLHLFLILLLTNTHVSQTFGQQVTPLFSNRQVEVKYAMFAPDGKTLAVATAGDSLLILDAASLGTKRIVKAFTSGSTMKDTYTGRKIFHITPLHDLLYIMKKEEGAKINLYLRSENLISGQLKFEVKLHSIDKTEYESEKLYNRLTYGLNVNDNALVFFLNEEIIVFDINNGSKLHELSSNFVFHASINKKKNLLAYVSSDSLKVIDLTTKHVTLRKKTEANGIYFKGDSLILIGKQSQVLDKSGNLIRKIYTTPGFVYGMEESSDGKQFTLSVSYFSENGFTTTYDRNALCFLSVNHLPKTDGYISFFHPISHIQYVLTTRGLLYEFDYHEQPKPVAQTGHGRSIVSVDFSKDKRTMISAASDGEIIVWDVHTGRIMERIMCKQSGLQRISFDEHDRDIFFLSYDEYRKIHRSIPSNPDWGTPHNIFMDPSDSTFIARKESQFKTDFNHTQALASKFRINSSWPMATSKKYFVTKTDEHSIQVVNLTNNEIKNYPLPKGEYISPESITFYKDEIIVFEGDHHSILFFDITNGSIIKRLGKLRNEYVRGIHNIIFNSSGDTLVTVSNHSTIQLWDLRKAEKIMELTPAKKANQEDEIDFKNGRLSFISENDNLYIATVLDIRTNRLKMIAYLDTTFNQQVNEIEIAGYKGKGYPLRLALSPDAKQLCVLRFFSPQTGLREMYVDIWDLTQMKLMTSTPLSDFSFPCWNVSWEHQKIAVWDFLGMSKKEQALLAKQNQQIGIPTTTSASTISIFDLVSKKSTELSLDKIGIPRITEKGIRFKNKNEIWIKDDFNMILHAFDLNKKTITQTIDVSQHFVHDRIGADFTMPDANFLYTVHPWTEGNITQFRSWSVTKKQVMAEGNSSGTPISFLSSVQSSGIFAIGLKNNSISIRNESDLKERYRIVQDDEGHYAFITPDNYYKAEKSSATALQFSYNFKSYSLQQFDAWYNRPDKILQATGFIKQQDLALLEKAYKKRTNHQPTTNLELLEKQQLPVITITNIDRIPLQTTLDSIKIEIEAISENSSIKQVEFLVNGVPVKTSAGIKIKEPKTRVTYTQYVGLLPGKNKISVRTTDQQDISSMPDEIEIQHSGTMDKPDLYLITVAINDYKNPNLKLTYAVKDARDLTAFFAKDTRFRKVVVDSIYNEAVSQDKVKSISKILQKVRSQDVVILFFAGHGVLDENFDFRYATWALDVQNPSETAILYGDLEKLLDNIHPRNKLLLIDACHSGEVDKDEIRETTEQLIQKREGGTERKIVKQSFDKIQHNVFNSGLVDRTGFELMQELFFAPTSINGSQAVVATAGDSYAIESAEWQNGFFTYALLNGLKTGVADTNQDQLITVEEMVNYLKQEVKRMSDGKQIPRFRQENPDNNFIIWKK